jgi:hypothetical protein
MAYYLDIFGHIEKKKKKFVFQTLTRAFNHGLKPKAKR